jgi:hypothetical protein
VSRWLAFERRWCRELCGAIVPISGNDLRRGSVDVSHACDRLLDAAPGRFRAATRLAVWVVMWSPLVVQHRLRMLSALDREGRDAVLHQTLASRHAVLRDLTSVLQLVACICLVGPLDPGSAREPTLEPVVRR